MRVFIAPCGIGLGHVARSHPIARELNRRHITTVFSTYLDGLDYARRNHLPTVEAVPISFRVTNDGTVDFKLTAATSGFSLGVRTLLRQITREIRYMKQFKPNVVLSDSRASSLLAAWLLQIPVILMLNQFSVEIIRKPSSRQLSILDRLFFLIANLGWLFIGTLIELVWGKSQVILIPDLPHPYTISLGNLAIPRRYNGKIKLIGPIVSHHNYNPSDLKRKLKLSSKKPAIYAAVSGPRVERTVLANLLKQTLSVLSSKYDVTLSTGNPEGTPRPYLSNGIRVFDWIPNQDDYIMSSDVIISRAGHGTIMKSLAYGKPMLLIPIPDHTEQYGNAKRAETLRVAKIVDQKRVNPQVLDSLIQSLLGKEAQENAMRIRLSTLSLRGVELACNVIENVATR